MYSFNDKQQQKALILLSAFHIAVIIASNYLVQFPFQIFGIHTTWGAFTFPFTFLTTDLTVRIFGLHLARKIIFCVMLPALLLSYVISTLFVDGVWSGWGHLTVFNPDVGRIALASFAAYVSGQLLDISVFNKLRQLPSWWIAPSAAALFGNAIDTLVFFFTAFHQSGNGFMAVHWPEIAFVDYLFKLLICALFFLPAYGILLKILVGILTRTNAK